MTEKTTQEQSNLINEFYIFSKYLSNVGIIDDVQKYQNDISAFLLHMSHLKAYQYAESFCNGKKVLDVGCNIGYGAKLLAKYAKEVVAIDFDTKAINYARENNIEKNIKFEKINAKKLPYDNYSFDVVTSFQVIEHIKPTEISIYLSEIHRVLKEEGVFLLTTPNRKLRLYLFEKPWNPEHHIEYSAKGLFKVLKKQFNNVEVLGLRAEKQIEEIEKNRIQKSFCRSFIIRPLVVFLKSILPSTVVKELTIKFRTVKSILRRLLRLKELNKQSSSFSELTWWFSFDSFRFESKSLDKSLYLFAICKKSNFL